ncbi:MAG: 5'-nucleotidase C-terminal domain-containing protein [Chitinophagaceae bacterium]|nr:5'-nucleotidase C-terminal domain-containing protein [Chitinophagaceae bacterium]MCW5903958.1 5'-nucleotidase C-terminal domain-containing protein [Chitinophagaceae bacterium]
MLKLTAIFVGAIFSILPYTAQSQKATVTYSTHTISKQDKTDSALAAMLKPYTENLNNYLHTVIGFSTRGLFKKQPESGLGNFMADCIREITSQKYERSVDIACINYGSIKSFIPKGDIMIEDIYTVIPFDNVIVLQEIKGNVLLQLLNKIAERGGLPISGIKMQIKNKQAENILINDKSLDENALYIIATNDYMANGGDGCNMLKNLPTINKGYLFRDAVIEYIQQTSKKGKTIDWKIQGRITYAN